LETAYEDEAQGASPTPDGCVGIIYGDVGSTSFSFSVIDHIERNEYVQAEHESCGPVLARVEDIQRKTDLSIDKAKAMAEGMAQEIEEKVTATVSVVGYRDDRGLLQVPQTPFRAGEPILKAEADLIKKVIGITQDDTKGAYVGLLMGHDLPIHLDINAMVQKHVSILAKTGGGKSYVAGVLMEEFMKHEVTALIIDPHGEYTTLKEEGTPADSWVRFGVGPRSYEGTVMEFSPDTRINQNARPLKFTLSNLDARDILALTNLHNARSHLTALRKALDVVRSGRADYSFADIMRVLEDEDDPSNLTLLGELEYLREVDIFAREGTKVTDLVKKGQCTVITMKGTPPDIQELIVNRLCTALFELRKVDEIPPLMLVMEEAHNFCPQQGKAASSKILRTVASEGRKFGLGLLVVTQRAAKVDKNVLSQCNTQIILKVTNPNDLKAIQASVEGLTTGMTEEIQRLPVGVAIVIGGGIQMPLFVEVRPRETKHGGASVKVLE
jgi:DNA helicase HerA-like ATPase